MFNRKLSLTIVLALATSLLPSLSVLALNYSGSQGNPATFETLEETRANSPAAVAQLETNNGKAFKSHPVLDGYPKGTTYVYRSANLFGGRAAARLNTDILLFAEKSFSSKDAALAYLKSLDLIRIIDEAIGSVVLVTPSDPKAGFTADDQKYYYALQTAMLAQKASERSGNVTTYYSDAEYFGGYGYTYVIGIDGGATFLNNYVAGTFDYVSRIAGMLLINGKMDNIRNVAALVPVYLVNAPESVIAKYKKVNDVDAYMNASGIETYFNQAFPLKKVVVAKEAGNPDAAKYIKDAYYNMFIKAMRVPVIKQGLYSASTPYQGYNFDEAPYSLCRRNAVINGVTQDGIHVIRKTSEMFSDMKSKDGEYLQTWFEYLPDEVLKGTAPAGTVPLILAMHGGGDDPRVFVDEIGLLDLAGSERFAMVAPEHQSLNFARTNDPNHPRPAVQHSAQVCEVHSQDISGIGSISRLRHRVLDGRRCDAQSHQRRSICVCRGGPHGCRRLYRHCGTGRPVEEGSSACNVHDFVVRPSGRFRSSQRKHRRRLPNPTQPLPWLQRHEDDRLHLISRRIRSTASRPTVLRRSSSIMSTTTIAGI